MKSELKVVSPTRKELKIEIDGATLKAAYAKVSQKYTKGANVPGFRKGYAPLDVVRMRFKEEIKGDVLQEVVPAAVTAAIDEHKLHPLTEPDLHLDDPDKIVVNGSTSIKLHAHVEVMPEIATPKYKGIAVTRRVKPVDDAEIENLITERLQKEAALLPVEGRKSKLGDTVIADLEGRFEDAPDAEPIKADDLEVELGGEHIEASFTENLIGVKADDEKAFTVTYPAEFSSEALAGKTVHYKAQIKSVGTMEVPKADDSWAKSLDEGYKSLADLKKRLRADLEKVSEDEADARVRNEAIAKMIEDNPFEVPNVLIENQARNLLNNFAQDMQQRGADLNQIDPSFIQMAYENMKTQATRDVSGAMLLDKIAEVEKVVVPETEVEEEIGKMAEYYRTTPKEIRESLEKQGGGVDNIHNNLKTRKTIEAVMSAAKVSKGEWIDETAEAAAAAEEKSKKPAKKKAAKKA